MKAYTRIMTLRIYDFDKLKYRYHKIREYVITTEEHIKKLNYGKRRRFTEAPGTLYDWYERIRDNTGEYYPAIGHIYKWEEENDK